MSTITPVAVREFGPDELGPGDAIIVNDPHRGSSHLNDITIISPVWVEGRRLGFVANMAHHIDVGGSSPASLGVNKELFQEGLILPPTRIARAGEIDQNVLRLILANIRAPRETNGDLRAQLSANYVGGRRMATLMQRYAEDTIETFYDELIAYTERWTDREIRQLPQGQYEAEGFRDDDGVSDEPVRLKVKVTIADGHVRLDITGSSGQRPGPLNANRAMAKTAVAFVIRCLVDDRIPVNDGFLRRLHVDGPDGTVCTAVRPAAVVGGWELSQRLTEVIFLPSILRCRTASRPPARASSSTSASAATTPSATSTTATWRRSPAATGRGRARTAPMRCRPTCRTPRTRRSRRSSSTTRSESRALELIPDSGGAGRFRGGLGVRRDFEFPYAACTWSVMSDGRKFAPWGLSGGQSGRTAHFILDPLGEHRDLPSKCVVEVPKGGRVRVETPGGGGFGDPGERDPEALVAIAATARSVTIGHTGRAPDNASAAVPHAAPPRKGLQ